MFRSRIRLPRQTTSLGLSTGSGAAVQRPSFVQARGLHKLAQLDHDYSQTGVPELLSADGFDMAWNQYMNFTLEKLNALTAGTELEDKDTKTISLLTAREPLQAPVFNYASMAHNNHFFFDGLHPKGTEMSPALQAELESSFSSIETLRREFVYTASAMFGPGFVWLVRTPNRRYKLLPTYLAGSPYPGAHWREQSVDMNALGAEGSARNHFSQPLRYGSARRKEPNLPPGGVNLQPLLCLNTWEHVWLRDYGFGVGGAGGKMEFAQRWWDKVDWRKVSRRAGLVMTDFKTDSPAPKPAETPAAETPDASAA